MTDLLVLTPDGEEAELLASTLYGAIFYTYGGAGPTHLYRNADTRLELLAAIEAWIPVLHKTCSPGWSYKRNAPVHCYDEVVH